jgi:STE24 endopeptidase
MNLYLLTILALLTGVFLLDSLADTLNLSHLKRDLPDEFKGVFEQEKYVASLNYQRAGVYFEFVRRTLSFLATILFIVLGGFNWADQLARDFHLNTIVTSLVFLGILSILRFLLQLPFSIYDTFVLEAKYEFNKTTPATFVVDIIKGAILGSILGGIIFSGIVYFFENSGPLAWAYSWAAFTVFQIALAYLAPAVIMPMFNKFSPLPQGPLREAIENYAKMRNFKLSGIFTMDSSKRSTKSNAFFTGFGKFRRLVLFDTLVSKHSQEELVAVLAHEIGHFERKHIIKSMALSIAVTGIVFFTFHLFMNNRELFSALKMEQLSVYASIVFVGLVYSPVLRILSILTQMLSRKYEFEADSFAVQTYGRPEILISALKKLSIDNLSHLTPHPLKVALDYSHPPILERINALRQKIRQ